MRARASLRDAREGTSHTVICFAKLSDAGAYKLAGSLTQLVE